MKKYLLSQLKFILKILARRTIKKYQPKIIAITGSVGKTSTKEAIRAVLAPFFNVRATHKNFNNEIGVPLTILGDYDRAGRFLFWFWVILVALVINVLPRKLFKYPEVLILEYGADRPGDLKYLLEIAKPDIGIVTAIGEIPVHVEFFSGPESVAREKARLIDSLSASGTAILNFDDTVVFDMKEKTRAKVMTFGFGEGADLTIGAFENRIVGNADADTSKVLTGVQSGISFKLEYDGGFVPVRIDGVFGHAHAYAAAAAAVVGLIFDINLVKISEALAFYRPAAGRMHLISGVKGSYIIDDTYNASPIAMHSALDVLKDLEAKRKIAVLGDMLEIGKFSIEAHEEVGRLAAKVADLLITVGPRAKFVAESANKFGLAKKNILSFDSSAEAKIRVQELIEEGDLVLVKGSRSMKMEKIVEEIMAEPSKAEVVLVDSKE